MSLWEAVLLGAVQGLTEFLPISSTAHLLVVRELLGHPHPEDAFTVVIQLGTLVAVFAYFRADVVQLARGFLRDLWERKIGATPAGRTAWLIILGTLPAVTVGALLKRQLKETFFNLPSIAVVSIVFALLMLLAERWAARRRQRGLPAKEESEIGPAEALWVGLWQAFALMPGGSRSGTTITGGLFAGLTRPAAARFSFLLSLPVILAAGVKELADEYARLGSPKPGEPPSLFASGDNVMNLLAGTAASALVGYAAIAFLLRFLQQNSTAVFVAYRLLLGTAILGMLAAGLLK